MANTRRTAPASIQTTPTKNNKQQPFSTSPRFKGSLLADSNIFGSAFAQNFLTPLSPRAFHRRGIPQNGRPSRTPRKFIINRQEVSSSSSSSSSTDSPKISPSSASTTHKGFWNTNKTEEEDEDSYIMETPTKNKAKRGKALVKRISNRWSNTKSRLSNRKGRRGNTPSALEISVPSHDDTTMTSLSSPSSKPSALATVLLSMYFCVAVAGLAYAMYIALVPEDVPTKKGFFGRSR